MRTVTHRPRTKMMSASILALGLMFWPDARVLAAETASDSVGDFPIWIELDKPQVVTVVIENEAGLRVRNLVAEMQLPAGRNRLSWDGYDDGVRAVPFTQRHDQKSVGNLTRTRVPPGKYRARGLTHDGIKLVYEFTAYSGGSPPWPTKDRTGAWMADHSAPLGALFLPAKSGSPYGDGVSQVMLTALIGEAGSPFVWADLDGKTLNRRQFWGWWGVIALTRDAGKAADPEVYSFGVAAKSKTVVIKGFKTNDTGFDVVTFKPKKEGPGEPRHEGHSLAVYDGLIVTSLVTDDELGFADLKEKKVLGTIPMPKPRGLLFDDQGRLLVISDGKVLRYELKRAGSEAPTLSEPTVLISEGLEKPRTMVFNPQGTELFVSDWGKSHQVKVFTPDGKPLRVIGKASDGNQLGLYDELKMQMPQGMAVDDRGQLWVVEAHHLPKRVSLWNATDGTYLRSHYGPPKYGGGGVIDPLDKTRMFYNDYFGLMEFELDWKAGTSKPKAILVNGSNKKGSRVEAYGIEHDPKGGSRWPFVGQNPVEINGRTYITGSGVVWMVGDDHVAWPVAMVGGNGFSWPPALNQNYVNAQKKAGLAGVDGWEFIVSWSDRNGNHKVDEDEYSFRRISETWVDAKGETRKVRGFPQQTYNSDLSMTANWGLRVPAPTFDENGIPSWDLSKADFLLPPQPMFIYGEGDPYWGTGVWATTDGWVVSKGGWGGWRDGQPMWTYPVMGADPAPMVGGEVVHPRGVMFKPVKATKGEVGYWYAINGEKGNMFLMTNDGLFLQTLGGDMRNTPLIRFPKAERGMIIDAPGQHISFEDEHYNPSITQTKDGEIYLVAGKEHSSIFRADGFESIRRREFATIDVSAESLAKIPEQLVIVSRKQAANTMKVEISSDDSVVDGKVKEYDRWANLGSTSARSAAVRIGPKNLTAAYRTGDPAALENSGGDFKYLFKRGGSVDLMIRTATGDDRRSREPVAGDMRLLVTKVNGQTKAVLYQPVVPGTPEDQRVLFDSPVGTAWFDSVTDVSDRVTLAQSGGDIEFSVPLELLGIQPTVGQELIADIGILRGDGQQTVQRIYWNNLNTFIVSDIPSEARFQPGNWGKWTVVEAYPALPVLKPTTLSANAAPGLSYARYKGKWEKLPDFSSLKPTATGVLPVPGLVGDDKDPNEFALEFKGFLRIPTDGEWTFTTNSNDGSRLWLGDVMLVENDGVHFSQDESRTIRLAAGTYPLRVGYFQLNSGKVLSVRWSGPGVKDQPIPAEALFHVP